MPPTDARTMERSEWDELERCLESVIPTYERMNRAMSLGQVARWRRRVQRHIRPGETVVELGSGPGQFAAGVRHAALVLVDPLPAMQRAAATLFDGTGPPARQVVGVGENVPLRSHIADHVVCAFSFRDFLDKRAGLAEALRLLRPGGALWILDVRKPPRQPMRALVGLHVRRVVPVLGRVITPRRVRRTWTSDPYAAFARTYDAFGTPDTYAAMAREVGFAQVRVDRLALGGAMLLSARAPRAASP